MMWHEDEQGPVVLPKGIDVVYKPIQSDLHSITYAKLGIGHSGCDHEYINVGFTSISMVCKKCNKEQK